MADPLDRPEKVVPFDCVQIVRVDRNDVQVFLRYKGVNVAETVIRDLCIGESFVLCFLDGKATVD